jgi:two-component system NtrC family response regulator
MEGLTILIADDETDQREVLAGFLRKRGHAVAEALARLEGHRIDLILTDYRMPDRTGYDLLVEARAKFPDVTVVLMTAYGTIEGAVAAMRAGAYDYLTKPIDLEEMDLLLRRSTERHQLLSENRLLRAQLKEQHTFSGIVSQSAAMESVLNTAGRVAQSTAPVLIRGESGTGKELVAKIIHFNSARKDKPFIAVNCAALNENLLESELFGHERGAFTGAERQHRGRFELAHSGTLFLDEIGDLPPGTQVKLLRVLQERSFERVGGSETITVDVRIIAATNRPLEQMLAAGTFREDLYYRLNVVTIEIPPLRERREDIIPLIEHFTKIHATSNNRPHLTYSREAWDLLQRYDFPGNVRELENIVHRSVILARGDHITTDDLPHVVRVRMPEQAIQSSLEQGTLPERVERLEKELVFDALQIHGGNQSRAAAHLGISERNLRYRLQKWGVKRAEG